jgi:CubicO group peptidase (beta-lactamase class C family)
MLRGKASDAPEEPLSPGIAASLFGVSEIGLLRTGGFVASSVGAPRAAANARLRPRERFSRAVMPRAPKSGFHRPRHLARAPIVLPLDQPESSLEAKSMRFVRACLILGSVLAATPATLVSAQELTDEMITEALPKLEAYADGLVRTGAVPGLAVAVVYKDQIVYLWGFGVREVGKEDPVDYDTVFQVASLSKAISSTVVSALVSRGTVSWDSRIADIDPEFQLSEAYPSQQVTVRDLFAHRSGLPGNAGNELEGLGYDRATILHRLRQVKPSSSFRAGYSYSNFGLTEGAVAAARAGGLGWEDAADQLLFGPLQMTSSSYRYEDFLAHENRATLHVRHNGEWEALSKRDPDPQAPAGGASSSARDLADWVRLVLAHGVFDGQRLIDEAALDEAHKPLVERGRHAIYGGPSFYGLGWNVTYGPHGLVWGHAGAFSNGARSVASLMPGYDLGIVVLANAFPTGAPEAVADTFFDLVFDGQPSQDWLEPWTNLYESLFGPAVEAAKAEFGKAPDDASPALPLAAYTGTYSNDYLGEAVVAEEGEGLVMKLGPGGAKSYPLTHFDRDLFLYTPAEEIPDMPSAATFRIGPDGKALSLTLDDLDDLGMGTLTRSGN